MHNILPSDAGSGSSSTDTDIMTPNKDLTGHKLVMIAEEIPESLVEHLRRKYPGLQVVQVKLSPWNNTAEPLPGFTDDDWATTTVLLTGPRIPTIEQAPKLQLVQLQSAGANYVLDRPLFKDTKIPFCTANGVAG